ncbi:MAG: MarR family transcriptional regulator [Cytophagaceae bacterium]|nr:MarR family transcriptional regulator [Cytophagaceae bacterium]MBK9508858.1 MarR family transcriptional regulator [Cytophagaceae bacterium]MBK9935763.1 MarR family transcriptional regulator [Cytophagaceae bacterium]MBL0302197.1 MarR family transcriptional regulator [Cytophagaceae bacterium]MBL0325023.1 MarR family transcriptional regulator [Cytophagaceae bacterium]
MKKEHTIDFYIKWAWHAISRMYNINAAAEDMTMSIGFVLLNIDLEKGTPATKIGPSIGMEARSLTRMLKTLEEKGWIYRETDPTDKRFVNVFLTDLGKKKRKFAREGVIEFNKRIQEKISPADLDVYFKVMKQINGLLEDISQENHQHEVLSLDQI